MAGANQSPLSVIAGSTRVARAAGIHVATSEVASRMPAIWRYAIGSNGLMP